MIECVCVTSVYLDGVLYEPGDKIKLEEASASLLIDRGAVAEVTVPKSKVDKLK